MTDITEIQRNKLEIIRMLSSDIDAARIAFEFIDNDELKMQVFKDQYLLISEEKTPTEKTAHAIYAAAAIIQLIAWVSR